MRLARSKSTRRSERGRPEAHTEALLVGGSSSNSLKQVAAESRRIELKIEFYDLKEPKETYTPDIPLSTDTTCPIDQKWSQALELSSKRA